MISTATRVDGLALRAMRGLDQCDVSGDTQHRLGIKGFSTSGVLRARFSHGAATADFWTDFGTLHLAGTNRVAPQGLRALGRFGLQGFDSPSFSSGISGPCPSCDPFILAGIPFQWDSNECRRKSHAPSRNLARCCAVEHPGRQFSTPRIPTLALAKQAWHIWM